MQIEDILKTSKFRSPTHKAHLNVLYSACWLKSRIHRGLKPFKVTLEQFNVLRIVKGQYPKGIWVKEISQRMIEPNSNTTRIIDRLIQKGMLVREASCDDGRARTINITEKGIQLLTQIDQAWSVDNPHESLLSAEEAQSLSELLDKMRDI
jgi:DNA-binding MarR family transcriptional regulator